MHSDYRMYPKLTEFADILWETWVLYQIKRLGSKGLIVFAHNCCMARMLPTEAELMSERTGLPGLKCKALWAVQQLNSDTALYKNITLPFLHHKQVMFPAPYTAKLIKHMTTQADQYLPFNHYIFIISWSWCALSVTIKKVNYHQKC